MNWRCILFLIDSLFVDFLELTTLQSRVQVFSQRARNNIGIIISFEYLVFTLKDIQGPKSDLPPPQETAYTESDKAVREKLLTLWSDFARHGGDPTPKAAKGDGWKRVRDDQLVHLEFTPGGETRDGIQLGDEFSLVFIRGLERAQKVKQMEVLEFPGRPYWAKIIAAGKQCRQIQEFP